MLVWKRILLLGFQCAVVSLAYGQMHLGLDVRTGIIGALDTWDKSTRQVTQGGNGPLIGIRAVLIDQASRITEMSFSAGYQLQQFTLQSGGSGLAYSNKDSLRITSGWITLGIAPLFAVSKDLRTKFTLGANVLLPLHATRTGMSSSFGLFSPTSGPIIYDHNSFRYGKFTLRLGLGLNRTFDIGEKLDVQIGPWLGAGLLNEASGNFIVRTLQALLSVQFTRKFERSIFKGAERPSSDW
ncbi:MAG TPA: hypothetical protein PLE78_02555 [Flavobacteriales bacterium]|jgi:hypothetical protein|nr:hypothetical protein [Flavobacteriales bacterium]